MFKASRTIGFLVAAGTLLTASPLFAQSYYGYTGGNLRPGYYDTQGHFLAGAPSSRPRAVARDRNGMKAFAAVLRTSDSADSPALTGGGSIGYNENLHNF